MTKCFCGKETRSFYDRISRDGSVETVTCCQTCWRGLVKGHPATKDGSHVIVNTLVRYFRREYKPMALNRWVFYLATM